MTQTADLPSILPAFPDAVAAELRADPRVDWHLAAVDIEAFVRVRQSHRTERGQHQQPCEPATVTIGRELIGIAAARVGGTMSCYPAGTITRCDDEVWVQTGRGHLAIDRIVVGGEERDAAAAWFVSAGFTTGDAFDTSSGRTTPSSPHTPRDWRRAA
jgi:methionyl-tRNA formyltransferase